MELVPELCTVETQGGQRGLGQQAEPGNARWGPGRGLSWLFWSWVWAVNVLLLQGSGVYVGVSVHVCLCAPYRAVWLRGGAPFCMCQWGHPETHLLGWWGPPGACPPRGPWSPAPHSLAAPPTTCLFLGQPAPLTLSIPSQLQPEAALSGTNGHATAHSELSGACASLRTHPGLCLPRQT